MCKENIIDAFKIVLSSNKPIRKAIYGNRPIPERIEDTLITLSSINFADLLIDIEERLGLDFAEEFMTISKITIGELAERIADYA